MWNRKLVICWFFPPPIFPLAFWIRKFSWKNCIWFVFLMFSWTIRSRPSRGFSGKGTPLGTGKVFSYFWRKFSFLMEQEQDMGFPALAASLLGRLGKDQEEGGGGGVCDELGGGSREWRWGHREVFGPEQQKLNSSAGPVITSVFLVWECLCNSLFKWRETLL